MKDYFRFFDKTTFLILLVLAFGGVSLIYSAGYSGQQHHYLKQIFWVLFALVCFFIMFSIKLEPVFRHSYLILAAVCIALLIQLATGRWIAGTRAWLRFGFFQVQVSEFVKIPLALALAKFLTTFETITLSRLLKLAGLIGVPVLLIALQPDFGVSFILCSFFLVILFMKKTRPILLIMLVALTVSVSYLGWRSVLKPYQKARILSFINPQKYSKTSGYQLIQSKIAVGSGGLSGKGYLKGSQSRYQFLPTRHTDFIISVLGEEFGFIGISLLFFAYFILFYRQFRFRFTNDEEFYFIYLFNGLILFQFLVNVAMAIGLFPVLGITLPFVSYGGSSILSFFLGEAILFRIQINTYIQ